MDGTNDINDRLLTNEVEEDSLEIDYTYTDDHKEYKELKNGKKSKDDGREFEVGKDVKNGKFYGNAVSTTRYTIYPIRFHNRPLKMCGITFKYKGKFIPQFQVIFFIQILKEQFGRVANLYFLLIACLQLFTDLSPTGRESTIIPLSIVIFFSMVKSVLEDAKKLYGDRVENNSITHVYDYHKKEFIEKKWKKVKVGDIVRINKSEKFPCDLIMMASSSKDGLCYIETSSLDGETNLKIRRSKDETQIYNTPDQLAHFKATITCEKPNKSLYTFLGSMELNGQRISLSPEQILLRGSSLRNIEYVYGIAVFTGHDTKLMNNQNEAPHKISKIENQTNRFIFLILGTLIFLCILCTIGSLVFEGTKVADAWYLREKGTEGVGSFFRIAIESFITFLILFNNLVPISLYVSVEIAKFIQGLFMSLDINMYYEPNDVACNARNSALNEELGQIDYIFSDKTGTLTCNKMELLKIIVGGVQYGMGHTEIEKSNARRFKKILTGDFPPDHKVDRDGFKFYDQRISKNAWMNQNDTAKESLIKFFSLLALCHTVIPEKNGKEIVYQAASPDEAALVKAAAKIGFRFIRRTNTEMTIEYEGNQYVYQIKNVLEFTSKRKRMSIIVRDPSNRLLLLTKGADNVLLPLLSKLERNGLGDTMKLLEAAAEAGLRTLVCAESYLDEEEYNEWNKEFIRAENLHVNREEELERVSELIERNLSFVGITAIEDELQEKVPETIRDLAEAGVKLWVLTGDKQATAINIGFACDLLNQQMSVNIIENENASGIRHEFLELIKTQSEAKASQMKVGLVVEGKRLKVILGDDSLRSMFAKIGADCDSVVCCRVSPSQKADVVRLIREKKKKITLSIGDGANDVPMIQAAHVGIGISGEEGLQACNASDYSFGQFRYLRNLLLVHGRWNYRRISKLILYSFYKNTVLYLTQMWFVLFNFFSGSSVHDRWTVSTYNILFTSLPIMALACFDRDVKNPSTILTYPDLYRQGRQERFFSFSIFLSWLINSIYHSAVCFLIPYFWMREDIIDTGHTLDKWSFGVVIYTCVLLTVTLKCALETSSFTLLHFICIGVSIFLWFAFVVAYGGLSIVLSQLFKKSKTFYTFPFSISFEFMGQFNALFQPQVYTVVILTVAIALGRDFVYKVGKRIKSRDIYYAVQQKGDRVNKDEIKRYSTIDNENFFKKQAIIEREGIKSLIHYNGFAFSQTPGISRFFNRSIQQ